jgi:L-fucose mutarotase
MLRGLDPLLSPELLFVVASMGHGDDLVLCDENFPANSVARRTTHGKPIRLAGIGLPDAVRAVLSVMQLDSFEPPVARMEVAGGTVALPDVQQEVLAEVNRLGGPFEITGLDRFAFYEAAKRSYAVVWTGERRLYGCFIFKKGVIAQWEH